MPAREVHSRSTGRLRGGAEHGPGSEDRQQQRGRPDREPDLWACEDCLADQDEKRAFEAKAETLEQLLEVRLVRIEEKLAGLDARLHAWSPASVNDAVRSGRDEQ